jgi:uncharacterized protein (TIGR02145 family)
MKHLLFILIQCLLGLILVAQTPQAFKYQAVARDVNGNLLMNQNVSFRMSILQGSPSGAAVYVETHGLATNDFGLVNLEVGNGTVVLGTFASIDWSAGPFYMKTELDASGGSSYQWMGTSQLLSVPYALYAESSGSSGTAGHKLSDADGNTYIDVEENPNEDTIRFYVAGNEKLKFDGRTLGLSNNGKSTFVGEKAGRNDNGANHYNTFLGANSGEFNTSGSHNTYIGANSGNQLATGVENVFVGYYSCGALSTGSANTFIGSFAGANSDNIGQNTFVGQGAGRYCNYNLYNTCVGYQSGENLGLNGSYNAFFGNNTGDQTTTGAYNSFFGSSAGGFNTEGKSNVFAGQQTGYSNTTGSYNTYLGTKSGFSNIGGGNNSYLGYRAGYLNETGTYNVIAGDSAAYNNLGSENVFIGSKSALNNTNGTGNVFIGYHSGMNESGSDRLYIENSEADKNNALIYGEFDNGLVLINNRLGIGTVPSTGSPLDIQGGTRFTVRLDSDGRSKVGNLYSSDDTLALASFGNVEISIDDNNNSTGKAFRVVNNTNQELFRVQDDNRVGIGTPAPGYRLHVVNGDAMVEDSSWCYFKIKSQNEGTDPALQLYAGDDIWALHNDDSDGNKFNLRYNNSTKMVITSDGNTGIGTVIPNASAILDASSTSKGFLPPRMSSTQIANIINPSNGLTAFSTTDQHLYVFNTSGNVWKRVAYDTETISPFTCGNVFVDPRDGKDYQTVQIGTQCWMAEGLNIGTKITSINQSDNGIIEKFCYQDNEAYCDLYGGYYQWDEMMQYGTTPGSQGICPYGWHVPSDVEYCTLTQFIDPTVNCAIIGWSGTDAGLKMKSTSGWSGGGNGTNSSGFTALPGGYITSGFGCVNRQASGVFYSSGQNGSLALARELQPN